ncbi:MAG: aminotransferase class V-fold PLP-dependent enzyme, partial [Rhodospirillales bacterium]
LRGGHHCAQPLMDRLGVEATTRASLALYNVQGDIDVFTDALDETLKVLA